MIIRKGLTLYPEHEKLKKIKDRSQAIGDFLDWLGTKHVTLCHEHQHGPACSDEHGRFCGLSAGELIPYTYNTNTLLAEYFGIDLNTLEAEKQHMIEHMRTGGESG